MSYLLWQSDAPINISKGTISMWFRVPKESAEKVEQKPELQGSFALLNMLPILAFTGQHSGPWTEMTFPVINTFYSNFGQYPNYQPVPYYGAIPGPTWQLPYSPCVIAVHINQDHKATLAVFLQTRDVGVPLNTTPAIVQADGVVGQSGPEAGLLFGPTKLYYENASFADAKMDWFDANIFNGPEVTLDQWHHILLSWDLQGSNSSFGAAHAFHSKSPPTLADYEYFTAKSKMYCAFDDKNLTRNKLPTEYWTDGFGDNEIACWSCRHLAGASYNKESEGYFGLPTYTVTFANGIQMDKVAIPSELHYGRWKADDILSPETEQIDAIKRIEVAELQIFAGVTLDTAPEINRRAFVSDDGKPVKPTGTEDDPQAPAEKLLGKKPEVLLHGNSNWQIGYNTGTLGVTVETSVDEEGNEIKTIVKIPSGQFIPTALIEKYKPEPALETKTPEIPPDAGL